MIQRRTFLGGLLAAVATVTAGSQGKVIPFKDLKTAEEKLLRLIPEPEEGFRLIITPAYNLPVIKASAVQSVTITDFAPSPIVLPYSGLTLTQYHPSPYVEVEVEGDDVNTMYDWMRQMIRPGRVAYASDEYYGNAVFGPEKGDPIIKFDNLFPTDIQTIFVGNKHKAQVKMQFAYVHQNIWSGVDYTASAET